MGLWLPSPLKAHLLKAIVELLVTLNWTISLTRRWLISLIWLLIALLLRLWLSIVELLFGSLSPRIRSATSVVRVTGGVTSLLRIRCIDSSPVLAIERSVTPSSYLECFLGISAPLLPRGSSFLTRGELELLLVWLR